MSYFTVDILTPSRVVLKDFPVDQLLIDTVQGQINVLPDHTHVVSKLDTGILSLKSPEGDKNFTTTTGIIKVLHKKITILSHVTESIHDIDEERAQKAKKVAEEKLSGKENLTEDELIKYSRKLSRAEVRLKAAMMKK